MEPEILLVEDDLHLREGLEEALSSQGYRLISATSCVEARHQFQLSNPTLAVMDVGLPDGSGWDLAKEFLSTNPDLKLLFLTARSSPEDRLHGLEMGAVDYVSKPFHLKELVLRLRNLSQISSVQDKGWIFLGAARVNFRRFLIVRGEEERKLSFKECQLLKLLYERAPNVVSREEMFEHVWGGGPDDLPTTRTIDNFILKLRRAIETDPTNPEILQASWGVGYSLNLKEST